jgi:hypothetical protein
MSAIIFVVLLPMSRSSVFGQQSPASPWSCAGKEMKSAMINVSYAASQTQILKPIHSKAILSRLDLFLTVMCTMTSYVAADCHFRQDVHRRMASVLARIQCAKERERGERARDPLSEKTGGRFLDPLLPHFPSLSGWRMLSHAVPDRATGLGLPPAAAAGQGRQAADAGLGRPAADAGPGRQRPCSRWAGP